MVTKIAVLGSINMDFICNVEEFPKPGETIKASNFITQPGGKGLNQAVAASKLGADVIMFGLLGNDIFGKQLEKIMNKTDINIDAVKTYDSSTGLAFINVNRKGENNIVIVPGANQKLDKKYIDHHIDIMLEADILLVQLEIPLPSVKYIIKKLGNEDIRIILDPAPAVELDEFPLENVNLLTPNETELDKIIKGTTYNKGIKKLFKRGLNSLIVKKGKEGSEYFSDITNYHIPAYQINEVDTTGAGDTFNAALAVALLEGKCMKEAMKFANVAGALTATRKGAQTCPSREEVEKILSRI